MTDLLRIEGIDKSFPGVKVFENFNFDLRKGEVHCICGENGAGKSTLIKILSGAHAPDKGDIFFEGKPLTGGLTPRKAIDLGIQTIYQEHTLYLDLTVAENMFVGNEPSRWVGLAIDMKTMVRRAEEVFARMNYNLNPRIKVRQLGGGAQKAVEIARGLVCQSKAIVMDEPTASFNSAEIDTLLDIVRRLRDDGIGVIYISHHLDEVFKIADRVTVIRDGMKINTYPITELAEEQLITDMVGRNVESFYSREKTDISEVCLEAVCVSGNGVRDVSLSVRRGEVLGIAGMVGSGRTELAELLFGAKPLTGGELRIQGKKVHLRSPRDSIRNRLCFITEDRQHTGLFLKHSITANTVIAKYNKTGGLIANPRTDNHLTTDYAKRLRVKTPSIRRQAAFLSGGNQQKVVLAKWFATEGEIFIFDEPTRGIDIGAKEEIYHLMVSLLKEGKAIIMISSDMPELLAMSDRIVVMRNGQAVGEVAGEEANEENILKLSIGGTL